MYESNLKMVKKYYFNLFFFIPLILSGQIEKQVRDDRPDLFINQHLFHSPPKPFFKGRIHNLDFITDISADSIVSGTLFLKMNSKSSFQEYQLELSHGLFRFSYDPRIHPGRHIEYYFIVTTKDRIFGTPVDGNGDLKPIKKLLVDPVQYYKQQARLNK